MFPLYSENRSRTFPFLIWVLIVLNGLVFWWELTQGFDDRIFLVYGETPALVLEGRQLLSLVTSMFIHVDFWHILGNMIYLFVFGASVEDRFGHVKFFLLYFVFGIAGALTHSAIAVMSGGAEAYIPTVGASGAVAGILGAYIVFYPGARIVSIVPSFFLARLARVPAFIFIGFWFILQVLYSGGSASVAYMAHIGGFIAGLVTAIAFRLLSREERTRWH
jgi:membrane associated rhomboid family serine protease